MKGIKTYLAIAAALFFAIAAFFAGQHWLVTLQTVGFALGIASVRYGVQATEWLIQRSHALGRIPKLRQWLTWSTQIVVIVATLAAYVLRLQGGEVALQFIAIAFAIAFLGSGVSKAGKAAAPG